MVDLGKSPLCESFLPADRLETMEPFYPLHVRVCTRCWLAQLPAFVTPDEIFTEYAYFSAYSDSWVEHSRAYVDMITSRLSLGSDSLVVELASNDGYLLQHFLPKGIPVLGIDPAANVAIAAEERGVSTLVEFFGVELAERLAAEGRQADLVLGNNVLAQVPDLNDFVAGVSILLAPGGTTTFEFPHLARLLEGLQYDTIYHEHFGYFSLTTIREIFAAHGLSVIDVEELASHGGSLRVYAAHTSEGRQASSAVAELIARERSEGAPRSEGATTALRDVEESKRASSTF
jgi:SAM-dependent methyltransferase